MGAPLSPVSMLQWKRVPLLSTAAVRLHLLPQYRNYEVGMSSLLSLSSNDQVGEDRQIDRWKIPKWEKHRAECEIRDHRQSLIFLILVIRVIRIQNLFWLVFCAASSRLHRVKDSAETQRAQSGTYQVFPLRPPRLNGEFSSVVVKSVASNPISL